MDAKTAMQTLESFRSFPLRAASSFDVECCQSQELVFTSYSRNNKEAKLQRRHTDTVVLLGKQPLTVLLYR